jgi:hypothetical protein
MSLRDAVSKEEFVFRFSGLNKLAQPAKTAVIMENTVAKPETHSSTNKVDGVNIHKTASKVATAEKEVAELKTKPEAALGRKADVIAKKDEKRPQARQRKEKPSPTTILIKDLSTQARKTKTIRKKEAQESVKEIIGSS